MGPGLYLTSDIETSLKWWKKMTKWAKKTKTWEMTHSALTFVKKQNEEQIKARVEKMAAMKVSGNNPDLWSKVLALTGGDCVAGGCIRDHHLGFAPHDIDVFFLGGQVRFPLAQWPKARLAEHKDYTGTKLGDVVDGIQIDGYDIQLISAPFIKTPEELVDGLDFGILRAWFDGTLHLTPEFDYDYQNKVCTLFRSEDHNEGHSYERWERWAQRNDLYDPSSWEQPALWKFRDRSAELYHLLGEEKVREAPPGWELQMANPGPAPMFVRQAVANNEVFVWQEGPQAWFAQNDGRDNMWLRQEAPPVDLDIEL